MTAVSENISSRDMIHVCTGLIVSSGGNIKYFSLSHSTIWQANKKKPFRKKLHNIRGVKRAAEDALFPIVAHFDGKSIENITDVKKAKRDLFAVSANIDGGIKLLGIPAMEHGAGAAQYDALAKVFEDCGMYGVKGLCFDTTASSTGRYSGTNIRFSQNRIKFYWSLPVEGIFMSFTSNISGSKST